MYGMSGLINLLVFYIKAGAEARTTLLPTLKQGISVNYSDWFPSPTVKSAVCICIHDWAARVPPARGEAYEISTKYVGATPHRAHENQRPCQVSCALGEEEAPSVTSFGKVYFVLVNCSPWWTGNWHVGSGGNVHAPAGEETVSFR